MEKFNYTDCMVDVETTGLDTAHSAIIQIGAVPFNYATGDIDSSNMFVASLTMPKYRFWTDDTQQFWLVDNREVYLEIMEKAEPYAEVMKRFHDWVAEYDQFNWWSKGFFDWYMIENYYRSLSMDMPFNFRQAKDMRSFISGLNGTNVFTDPEVEKVGSKHNALHDCLTQLKQLFKDKEGTCQSVIVTD